MDFMNTTKVLELIYLLSRGSEGKEKELSELYRKALYENTEYRNLLETMKEIAVFGTEGRQYVQRAEELMDAAANDPKNILSTLEYMSKLCDEMERQAQESEGMMRQPLPVQEDLIAVRNSRKQVYDEVLESIGKMALYFICISENFRLFDHLNRWKTEYSVSQKFELLNREYLPVMLRAGKAIGAWEICKAENIKEIRFCDTVYYLRSISVEQYFERVKKREIHKLKENLYYDRGADLPGVWDVPVYMGLGNLISAEKERIMDMFAGYRSDYKNPDRDFMERDKETLDQMLDRLCGGEEYIIHPLKAVFLLNQLEKGRSIVTRMREKKCLFCGKVMQIERYVCEEHVEKWR